MTKEQVRGLRTRITKDVDQLFHHIAGLDMACDEAIDWGKVAEIDMRKAQEQSRLDRSALEDLAKTECRQAERDRCVAKIKEWRDTDVGLPITEERTDELIATIEEAK